MKVPFNIPLCLGTEIDSVRYAVQSGHLSGDQDYNKKCAAWFERNMPTSLAIPTPSCTAALEMGLMLAGIGPGDEVILPSFTFTSTATAIVLHGGVPVFVDSCPDVLNMNTTLIEAAITDKTKAIMPVHYGGISCDMGAIMEIARNYDLVVLEDAAQCVWSFDRKGPVGSKGHMSAFSFHETKNITCGEGGMLCINDERFIEKAEIARDKGTDRQKFFRGMVDKYSWQDKGSSYLMSELQAAYLSVQLERADNITQNRLEIWAYYHESLKDLESKEKLRRPVVPEMAEHNAHLYYILLPTPEKREALQSYLSERKVYAAPHYVPLHSSAGGKKFGKVGSETIQCEDFPNRLLRLPLYYGMEDGQRSYVIEVIDSFCKKI